MRLIVMGQQAFGKDVLTKLLDTGTDEVVAVYCEPDREGKPVDPIKAFAEEQGLPVHNTFKKIAHVAGFAHNWLQVLEFKLCHIKGHLARRQPQTPHLHGAGRL